MKYGENTWAAVRGYVDAVTAAAATLIDHQKEMFEAIRSETPADSVELNVRLLGKTAKAFDGMRPI
jgi:hypothetical protein